MPFAKGTVTAAEEAEEEDVIDLCDSQPVDPGRVRLAGHRRRLVRRRAGRGGGGLRHGLSVAVPIRPGPVSRHTPTDPVTGLVARERGGWGSGRALSHEHGVSDPLCRSSGTAVSVPWLIGCTLRAFGSVHIRSAIWVLTGWAVRRHSSGRPRDTRIERLANNATVSAMQRATAVPAMSSARTSRKSRLSSAWSATRLR